MKGTQGTSQKECNNTDSLVVTLASVVFDEFGDFRSNAFVMIDCTCPEVLMVSNNVFSSFYKHANFKCLLVWCGFYT